MAPEFDVEVVDAPDEVGDDADVVVDDPSAAAVDDGEAEAVDDGKPVFVKRDSAAATDAEATAT